MKTTKRLITLQYNYYNEIEEKLDKYASEGLVLKKCNGMFWTFEKTEPKNLKYTVTYFKEGSIFNPEYTDNQLTYFDYAKEGGWEFVCEHGQMQIFKSSLENPIPFDTDDNEKLKNIHACMKKSFIPTQVILFFLWFLNSAIRIPSIFNRATDFLASKVELLSLVLFIMSAIFSAYSLMNYYNWYNDSKKSIEIGGEIKSFRSNIKKIYERVHVILLFILLIYMFANLFKETNFGIIVMAIMQVPIFIAVFFGAISIQKRFKISAKINKIVTFIVYILTVLLYCGFVFSMLSNFNFNKQTEKEYRVVKWSFLDGETYDYRLYNDKLPLTCQDLYGDIDFEDYSYENNIESTFLLTKNEYSQSAPPTNGKPPEISYTIYSSKFNFVDNMINKELLASNEKFDLYLEPIENESFNTKEAYTFYYLENDKKSYHGEYLLIYDDKIIHLNLHEQLNENQKNIVNEKLSFS